MEVRTRTRKVILRSFCSYIDVRVKVILPVKKWPKIAFVLFGEPKYNEALNRSVPVALVSKPSLWLRRKHQPVEHAREERSAHHRVAGLRAGVRERVRE